MPPVCICEGYIRFQSCLIMDEQFLNKLFWLINTYISYMFDMPWVLNMLGFRLRHGCIRNDYTEFWIYLNMTQYTSIMPEYALMSLSMPEHDRILLIVPEYTWQCLNKMFWTARFLICFILDIWQGVNYARVYYALGVNYARVLNIRQCSYSKVIIVTNVNVLEFLSAQFVNSGSPKITIWSFLNTS